MPQVVNGVGTWYYGRSDESSYSGICTQCNATTRLVSYDTRLWFVIFFIPVIPLGRKRVVDECGQCQRHLAIPHSEWHVARTRMAEAERAFDAAPADRERGMEAMAAYAAMRDRPGFDALAPKVEERLGQDPEVLLVVAAVHGALGNLPERERVLRKAVALAPEDERSREALADCLIDKGEVDEAAEYVCHIEKRGIPDKVWLLLRLAEVHQLLGRHEDAVRLFDVSENIEPRLAEGDTFNALREASRARVGKPEPIRPRDIQKKLDRQKTWAKALRVAPAVVLLLVGAWAAVAWARGAQREVWLVSGLSVPYAVNIDGRRATVSPDAPTKVSLGEGSHSLVCEGPARALGTRTFTVETPFWSRPISVTQFVVNPDECALLGRLRVHYGHNASEPTTERWQGGGLVFVVDGVDHVFEDPPRSLRVERGQSVTRTVLYTRTFETVADARARAQIARDLGAKALAALAERRLKLQPDNELAYGLLSMVTDAEHVARLVEPGLAERPLLLERHRAYQDALESLGREAELAQRYDKLLAETNDTTARYLRARVESDPRAWERQLRDIAKRPDAPLPAARSLAMLLVSTGQIEDALAATARYCELAPGDAHARRLFDWCLEASGQGEQVAKRLADERAKGRPEIAHEVVLLATLGRDPGPAIAASMKGRPSPDAALGRALLGAYVHYARGDTKQAGQTLLAASNSNLPGLAGLMEGDPLLAARMLSDRADVEQSLAIWLMFARTGKGDHAAAKEALARVVQTLGKDHGRSGRMFARALAGTPPLPAELLARLYVGEDVKPLMLAALGTLYPADRATYFDLARKINVQRKFPYHLVREVVDAR